jgi:hypothetical protein
MDLRELTHETFAERIGQRFTLAEPAAVEFELEAARLGPEPPDAGRHPFSLVFRGPRDPLLPQSIYALEHDGELGTLEIFIVPIARDAGATRYEAVFT